MPEPIFLKYNKRFYAYPLYMLETFGKRFQKLAVNAGFTCPNRDGTKGTNGCSFCYNPAFNPSYCTPEKSIKQQIDEGITFHKTRYRRVSDYLVYFQPYSNTYAKVDILEQKYNEALQHHDVKGIIIGTRPDCVDDEVISLLSRISKTHHVFLELGIESCYNRTLHAINRGHTVEDAVIALEKAEKAEIKTGAHFILGLPGESNSEMLDYANFINKLPLHSVKFHQLQILKGTVMATDYQEHPEKFRLFSLEEYTALIIELLEHLRPTLPIERLAGEVPPRYLAVPPWGKLRNDRIIQYIESEMDRLNTFQGKKYPK